jgi:hypothetical protein
MPTSSVTSTFADRALSFLGNLQIKGKIPPSIEVLNPYRDAYTMGLCEAFYKKYYNDNKKRTLLVGINPGRFGSGSTGVSFTDPIKLETICGIPNNLIKKPELSADFIYAMIEAYGGPKAFYKNHFISAVSPLGFTSEGKNINYYDDKNLQIAITPFVEQSISTMLTLGIDNTKCFCIGEGKNLNYLTRLNDKHGWFKTIIPLSHPRFIMQYKRKKLGEYIDDYLTKLTD